MAGFAWMHPDDELWTMQLEEQLERDPNSLRGVPLDPGMHAAMLDVHAGDEPEDEVRWLTGPHAGRIIPRPDDVVENDRG